MGDEHEQDDSGGAVAAVASLPASLTFRFVPDGGAAAGAAALPMAAAAALALPGDDRIKVLLRLDTKEDKLRDCVDLLTALYRSETDPLKRRDIALQRDEARSERELCATRYEAIDANGPFRDPGPAADAALRNAIQRVDVAIRNTAALSALLGAIHGLVVAFPASST